MRATVLACFTGLLLLCNSCSEKGPAPDFVKLIDSWDLVSWKGYKEDGTVIYPYGKDAKGMLIYTDDNTAVLSLSKNNRPRLGSDFYQEMSRDTLLEAYSGFFSYHGNYLVDDSAKTVTHIIDACKIPDWEGREIVRHYSFSADTLVLRAPKVIGLNHELKWTRRMDFRF